MRYGKKGNDLCWIAGLGFGRSVLSAYRVDLTLDSRIGRRSLLRFHCEYCWFFIPLIRMVNSNLVSPNMNQFFSRYTMTKSTAVIFILFFALLFRLEERHSSLVFVVLLISGGLVLFTYKSTQFHPFGFSLVLAASVLSGFRWAMAQRILQKTKLGLQNPVDMMFHVQPWMLIGVLPFAIFFEGISFYRILLNHHSSALPWREVEVL